MPKHADELQVCLSSFILQTSSNPTNSEIQGSHSIYFLEPAKATAQMKYLLVSSSADKNSVRTPQQMKRGDIPAKSSSASPLLDIRNEKNDSMEVMDSFSKNLEHEKKSRGGDKKKYIFGEPRALDICCGRGKGSFCHPGNLIFQEAIRNSLDRYDQATSKNSKSAVVSELVASLNFDHNLRFIKKDPVERKWFVLPFSIAHEKTGHAIRDQLCAKMRQNKQPIQGKSSRSSPTTIACSSACSSKNSNRDIRKKVKKGVCCEVKHQVQKNMIKNTSNSKQRVFEEEPKPLHFQFVGQEDEEHQEPWSDHFTQRDMAACLLLFGDDNGSHLDFKRCDGMAKERRDLNVTLPPQGTLPKGYPTPYHRLSQYGGVSVEDTSRQPASPKSPQVKILVTDRRRLHRQLSPENNRKLCIQRSTLPRTQDFPINGEEDLEPIPLSRLPPHAQDIETSWHTTTDHRIAAFSEEERNFGLGHKSTNDTLPNDESSNFVQCTRETRLATFGWLPSR